MKYLFIVFLILLASAAVPQLTRSNIEQTLKSQQLAIVKFFSPNCGHCVAMAPEYEKLYSESEGKKYKVYEVDCSVQETVCNYVKIEGYPTLRLYSNGAYINYDGERTAQEIQKWINSIQNASLEFLQAEQAKAKIGAQTFVLVSGLSDKEVRSIALEKVNDKFGTKVYALQSSTTFIRLYTKGSDQFKQYTKDDNFPASLLSWAFDIGREPILQLTNSLFNYLYQQSVYPYIAVLVDQNDDFADQAEPILSKWCDENRFEILCFSANKQSESYQNVKKTIKASEQKSTLSFIKSDFSIGYHYTQQSITSQSFDQFIADAKTDKIYRSIDEQRELNAKFAYVNIVRLNNQNYNQTISENDYVFVEYYSPRCGHCVKFAEEYEQVATKLKETNPDVIVAGVDANAQRQISSQEGIEGFPTFKMFVYGQALEYPGERSAESMIEFINSISSSRLSSVQSIDGLSKPFIAIRGIEQRSQYDVLPTFFDTYPIYRVTGQSQFEISVHVDGGEKTYSGENKLQEIVDWIIDASSPVLVSLGESVPSKKLQRAIGKKIPILVVLNKHQRQFAAPALSFLQEYCKQQTQFICGYVHKDQPDYEYLLEWSGDQDTVTNRLVWINTSKLSKYLYKGDPNEVTKQSLDEFVTAVKEGRISPHKKGQQVKAEQQKKEELQEL